MPVNITEHVVGQWTEWRSRDRGPGACGRSGRSFTAAARKKRPYSSASCLVSCGVATDRTRQRLQQRSGQ